MAWHPCVRIFNWSVFIIRPKFSKRIVFLGMYFINTYWHNFHWSRLLFSGRGEMNAETLKALRGSIKKLDEIVKGTGVDDCPTSTTLAIKELNFLKSLLRKGARNE